MATAQEASGFLIILQHANMVANGKVNCVMSPDGLSISNHRHAVYMYAAFSNMYYYNEQVHELYLLHDRLRYLW